MTFSHDTARRAEAPSGRSESPARTIGHTSSHLAPGVVRDLRDLTTDDLAVEIEVTRWDYLRARERGVSDTDHSQQIRIDLVAAMEAEIATRERLLTTLGRHAMAAGLGTAATPTAQRRAQEVKDLKRVWPIERFVTVVMDTPLTLRGARPTGTCPLPDHDDRSPSFTVYSDTDSWYCFGCGRGGDLFTLAGYYFGLDPRSDFPEIVRRVRDATRALIGGAP